MIFKQLPFGQAKGSGKGFKEMERYAGKAGYEEKNVQGRL